MSTKSPEFTSESLEESLDLAVRQALDSARQNQEGRGSADSPLYWKHRYTEPTTFGVGRRDVLRESGTAWLHDGNRVDVQSHTIQSSVLGIQLAAKTILIVTKRTYDGSHESGMQLDKGEIIVTSDAPDPSDEGAPRSYYREVFKKGEPEYQTALRSNLTTLGEVIEAN